jgi:hypothetical protein
MSALCLQTSCRALERCPCQTNSIGIS